jgi:hypothetical protein
VEEAAQFVATDHSFSAALRALLAGPALARRRVLKHFSYHLPCRPQLRFLYQYYLRGGFRDGPGAKRYCGLLARYEKFAVEEIRRQRAVKQNRA